ncbi:MAG: cbb3-type cytochrome c oxidase subunit I [Candidatus Microthrix sp.]|jgi:heme/copper-type cytochrome/quinol oxidase subunit 1|uniref:cbb3-type cytochrome c oxidase subunit I n=1 Tax=Candidatus Neomicrothrix TaxID=41949 RepID=UPI000362659E|nr:MULTISPECIES: cbb3-type cytochrome c oxidase subunit I [Microthrix]MBP7403393.1 cbb3-type cytochrome c oxidase subunit I [Candidatus Microthrix sp.]MBP7994143.1 cbb3-type cytochrome c oxidase subunit I [Candidatus Microthrix sp.]MBP9620428.1 cbb3-type cytochrome c oxidase subunit I [Candidatus Microthrix sp.]
MAVTDTTVEAPPAAPPALAAAKPESRPQAAAAELTAIEHYLGAVDHKRLGRRFTLAALLVTAGLFVARAVGWAGANSADPLLGTWSVQVRQSADIAVIVLGVMALIVGLAIYVVPLQVGARGISFPRLVALSYYSWLISTVLYVVSILGDGGLGGNSYEMGRLGIFSLAAGAVSLLGGMIAVMTTVLTLRAPGMTLARTPMFAYSMLVSGALWLATVPAIVAVGVLMQANRAEAGAIKIGAVADLRFLGWQPAIWIIAIPVIGLAVDVLPVATGARLMQRFVFRGLIVVLGVASFGVWAVDPNLAVNTFVWAALAVLALVAVLATLAGLLPQLRRLSGAPAAPDALVGVLAALGLLALAGIVGTLAALNTYGGGEDGLLGLPAVNGLIDGQSNMILGGAVAGLLAALAFWGVKFTGSMPAKGAAAGMALLAALGGLLAGVGGVIDAVASIDGGAGAPETAGWLIAAGSVLLALSVLGAAGGLAAGLRGGESDGPVDPFDGHTLEWLTSSPPSTNNFDDELPEVVSASPLLDAREASGTAEGSEQ